MGEHGLRSAYIPAEKITPHDTDPIACYDFTSPLVTSCAPPLWQKSSKLSRVSSGEDDLEKDGKEGDQKSNSEGGDTDGGIIQNATDNKVGLPGHW